jgi:hypothetical protein
MLNKIAVFITRLFIRRNELARNKKFLSWEKVESIALLLDNADINKSQMDAFTDGLKKYVEVFYLESHSKAPSYGNWRCITKEDLTFLGMPNKALSSEIDSKKFDVLIAVTDKNETLSANLTARINATYKCANKNVFGEADLIIKRQESKKSEAYLREVQKYLEMIRTS